MWVPAPRVSSDLPMGMAARAPQENEPTLIPVAVPCHKRVGSHGGSRVFPCWRATLVLHPAHFRHVKLSYPANLRSYRSLHFTT